MFLLVCFFRQIQSSFPQDYEKGCMMHSGQHKLLDRGIPIPRKWRRREEMGGNRGEISRLKRDQIGLKMKQNRAKDILKG